MTVQNIIYFYSSPIGTLEIQFKENQLYSLSKLRSTQNVSKKIKTHKLKHLSNLFWIQSKRDIKPPQKIISFVSKLNDYFSGKKIRKWSIPLSSRGTLFQQKVWKCLSQIPYGETRTYSKVAQEVCSPQAMRAVGSACGQNPWLIIVPCHRVVAQKGLGGFALGLKTKSFLLHHENKFCVIKLTQS